MAPKRIIFLNIIILIGLLPTLVYILNLNNLMQPRHDFIRISETLEERTSDEYEHWLASAEQTNNNIKDLPSNKISPPQSVHNSAQQFEVAQKGTTFADLREYLCHKEPKSRRRTLNKSTVRDPCPKKHIVTYVAGGRTANQMWKYAELWAFSQKTGLTPYVPGCVKYGLGELFETLSIPNMDNIVHCNFDVNNTTASSIATWNGNQSIVIPPFQFSRADVMPFLHRIVKEEFVFKKELQFNAQKVLGEALINVTQPELVTFVGVHIRRTDYIQYLKKNHKEPLPNSQFYHKAMIYYKNKYKRCLFVFISDDPEWCHDKFGTLKDVFIASYQRNNTAGEDLAIMAACNHSIIDYGTYGEWGAILAGGETIFANRGFQNPTAQLEGWKFIN